jgi:uncharacterized protein YcfJ
LNCTIIPKEKAMNVTKKLICVVTAGATLGLGMAAPAFADPGRDHRYYGNYERRDYRGYDRDYNRRHFVVQRPIVVERPAYYAQPYPYAPYAPYAYNIGPAAVIGAVIGGLIDHDNRRW